MKRKLITISIILVIVIYPNIVCGYKPTIILENGKGKFSFLDKLATSTIHYQTIGWLIHEGFDSNNSAYKDMPCGAVCQVQTNQEKHEDKPKSIPKGYVRTYFEITQEEITNAMIKAGMSTWESGDVIYLDSIFVVLDGNNNVVGSDLTVEQIQDKIRRRNESEGKLNLMGIEGIYCTLDEIQSAQPWADPESLADYFNVDAIYNSSKKHPFAVQTEYSDKQDKDIEYLGEFESGTWQTYKPELKKEDYVLKKIEEVNSTSFEKIKDWEPDENKSGLWQIQVGGTLLILKYEKVKPQKTPIALVEIKHNGSFTLENGKRFETDERQKCNIWFRNKCFPADKEVKSYEWRLDTYGEHRTTYDGYDETINMKVLGKGLHTLTLTMNFIDGSSCQDDIYFYLTEKEIPKEGPVAKIRGDDKRRAGDNCFFDGKASHDSDGKIEEYNWSIPKGIKEKNISGLGTDTICTWFDMKHLGRQHIGLTVSDNDGLTDSDDHYIQIVPPTFEAKIDYSGKRKVNRKLTLFRKDDAPFHYPVRSTTWDIKSPYKFGSETNRKESISILPKKEGQMPVNLQASNGYFTAKDSKTLTIEPDLPPIADFKVVNSKFYRNPYDDLQAQIRIQNKSVSKDGDFIKHVTVKYIYDANNDGVFDETQQIGYDGDSKSILSFKVRKLGKYKLFMTVTEGFTDTIPELLTEDDYLKSDTSNKPVAECIVEVDNKAPIVGIKAIKKMPVDVTIAVDKNTPLSDWKEGIDKFLKPELDKKDLIGNVTLLPYIKNTPIKYHNPVVKWRARDDYAKEWNVDYHFLRQNESYFKSYGQSLKGTYMYHAANVHGDYGINVYKHLGGTRYRDREYSSFYFGNFAEDYALDYAPFSIVIGGKTYWYDGSTARQDGKHGGLGGWDVYPVAIDEDGNLYVECDVEVWYERGDDDTRRIHDIYVKKNFDTGDMEVVPKEDVPKIIDEKDWVCDYTKDYFFDYKRKKIKYDGWREYHVYGDFYYDNELIYSYKDEDPPGRMPRPYLTEIKVPRAYPRDDLIVGVYDKINWQNDHRYFTVFQDLPVIHFHEDELVMQCQRDQTALVPIGSEDGQDFLQSMIDSNDGRGVFLKDTKNIEKTFKDLAHYIKVDSYEHSAQVNYITLDEAVRMETENMDYERDKITDIKWRYEHDADYFESSLGEIDHNGELREKPIERFDKVGKYLISAVGKDHPTEDEKFQNYNKWSEDIPHNKKYTLYVHRRPIADFNFSVYRNGLTITDKSYDIDHKSESKKGIVEHKWQWLDPITKHWNEGLPDEDDLAKMDTSEEYSMCLRVKDQEGAWSKPCFKTFEPGYEKPMTISAKVRPKNPMFSLNSIPAGEQLELYDIVIGSSTPITHVRGYLNLVKNERRRSDKQVTFMSFDYKEGVNGHREKVKGSGGKIEKNINYYNYYLNDQVITIPKDASSFSSKLYDGKRYYNSVRLEVYDDEDYSSWSYPEKTYSRNFIIYTPLWEDYAKGSLNKIDNTIKNSSDVLELSTWKEDKINNFTITTSKYTKDLEMKLLDYEIMLYEDGTMKDYTNYNEEGKDIKINEEYRDNYYLMHLWDLNVKETEFDKIWTFKFACREDYPIEANSEILISFYADDYNYMRNNFAEYNPQQKIFSTVQNKPPVIQSLDVNPNTIYDGQNTSCITSVFDEDFDKLQVNLILKQNNKVVWSNSVSVKAINEKYPSINNNMTKLKEGTYKLYAKVTDPYGQFDEKEISFKVNPFKISNFDIWGEWNHWRGQKDIFNRTLSKNKHRFMSYEAVHVRALIIGNPDDVYIRFSDELEQMIFKDKFGHQYKYEDQVGYKVSFPLSMKKKDNDYYEIDYVLPLANSTLDQSDRRLKPAYWVEVTAKKGDAVKTMKIDNIELTGNILDKMYIQSEE